MLHPSKFNVISPKTENPSFFPWLTFYLTAKLDGCQRMRGFRTITVLLNHAMSIW